jgi:hypothetical protein
VETTEVTNSSLDSEITVPSGFKAITVKSIVGSTVSYMLYDDRHCSGFDPHVSTDPLTGGDGEPLGTRVYISRIAIVPGTWAVCNSTDYRKRCLAQGRKSTAEMWVNAGETETLASEVWALACAQEKRYQQRQKGWQLTGDERAAWVDAVQL